MEQVQFIMHAFAYLSCSEYGITTLKHAFEFHPQRSAVWLFLWDLRGDTS